MADQLHTHHRQRVLERFRRFGLAAFADHEVLELLLFFAIPRADTNGTAHRLLERFGSLHAVLEAPAAQLQQVEGIGPRAADLLTLCFALVSRYQMDVDRMEQHSEPLNNAERIGAYFVPQLQTEREEVLLAAYLDGAGRVIKCEEVARGGRSHVQVDPYKIASGALFCQAAGVAIAHNHPNGAARPSEQDLRVTAELESALRGLGIELVDHCIVARDKFCSVKRIRAAQQYIPITRR